MRNPTVVRGISAASPALAFENKRGTPLSTVTGTPTPSGLEGSWQLQIQDDFQSGGKLAVVMEHFRGGSTTQRPVKVSTAYTDLIPGLTITLGATLNVNDIGNIIYSKLYVVNT